MAAAKTSDKVMQLVEKELNKKPDATVDDLYEKAKKASRSISQLSKRQFNARYPLQVKRRKSRKAGKKKSSRKSATSRRKKASRPSTRRAAGSDGGREAVRKTFMKFASDMASADDRKELVRFLAGIDSYVDEVLKATSK